MAVGGQANRARGAYGERRAAEWYTARGYRVLDRNWRNGRSGEIDLVLASPEGAVVFCEVKARRSDAYGDGALAVTAAKQMRLRGLALAWLAAHPMPRAELRFDVVSVTGTAVEVFEAAF